MRAWKTASTKTRHTTPPTSGLVNKSLAGSYPGWTAPLGSTTHVDAQPASLRGEGYTMVSRQFKKHLKRSALTVALGLCVASGVHAQSTTGSIYGTVPGDGNASIVISNNSGFS